MMTLYLLRLRTSLMGTEGVLTDFGGLYLFTLELPWKQNQKSISCIPDGIYNVSPYWSKRFGQCFHLLNVPDREAILIHKGNFAGDISSGYKTDSHGCILIGLEFGLIQNQRAILKSSLAMAKLLTYIKEPFILSIGGFGWTY